MHSPLHLAASGWRMGYVAAFIAGGVVFLVVAGWALLRVYRWVARL